jgi:hypothetical protein
MLAKKREPDHGSACAEIGRQDCQAPIDSIERPD